MALLKTFKPGPLAKSTLIITGGMGIRVLMLAALFLLVSRTLGIEQYGQFSATLALVSFFYPFVGLGASMLLLRDIARSPEELRKFWGRALLITVISGAPLAVIATLVGKVVLPEEISLRLIFYLAVAELVLTPITQLVVTLYQALEKSALTAAFLAGTILFRLGAFLALMILLASPSAESWGLYYLASTLFFTLLVMGFARRDLGAPVYKMPDCRTVVREGLAYSVMQASGRLSTNVDKVMLSRLDSLATTGLYSAAYRIMEMLFLPLSALLWTSISRFFRSGTAGASATLRYGLKFLPIPLLYIIICLIGVYFWARYLPVLLGSEFAGIEAAVIFISPLMAALFIRNLLRLVVVGTQSTVSAAVIEVGGALTNIAANLVLIPTYSWKGAILATLISEFVMIALLSIVLTRSISCEKSDVRTKSG